MKFLLAFLASFLFATIQLSSAASSSCSDRLINSANWQSCCIPRQQYNQMRLSNTCRSFVQMRMLGNCPSQPFIPEMNEQKLLRLRVSKMNCCEKFTAC